jgi:hypothetical protein
MSLETTPSIKALMRRQAVYEHAVNSLASQVNALRKKVAAAYADKPVDWSSTLNPLPPSGVAEEQTAANDSCDRVLAYNRGRITFEEFIGANAEEKAPS